MRFRDSTLRDVLCCHKGLALADTQDQGETAGKWRYKDLQGQLLSPHPTCPEGKNTQPERKGVSPAPRPGRRQAASVVLLCRLELQHTPFVLLTLDKPREGGEEKYFI